MLLARVKEAKQPYIAAVASKADLGHTIIHARQPDNVKENGKDITILPPGMAL